MLSIFSLGLWPILVLFLIGVVVFGYKAWKGYNSGSIQQTSSGTIESDKKIIPVGYTVLTGVCLLAAILFLIFAGK